MPPQPRRGRPLALLLPLLLGNLGAGCAKVQWSDGFARDARTDGVRVEPSKGTLTSFQFAGVKGRVSDRARGDGKARTMRLRVVGEGLEAFVAACEVDRGSHKTDFFASKDQTWWTCDFAREAEPKVNLFHGFLSTDTFDVAEENFWSGWISTTRHTAEVFGPLPKDANTSTLLRVEGDGRRFALFRNNAKGDLQTRDLPVEAQLDLGKARALYRPKGQAAFYSVPTLLWASMMIVLSRDAWP